MSFIAREDHLCVWLVGFPKDQPFVAFDSRAEAERYADMVGKVDVYGEGRPSVTHLYVYRAFVDNS